MASSSLRPWVANASHPPPRAPTALPGRRLARARAACRGPSSYSIRYSRKNIVQEEKKTKHDAKNPKAGTYRYLDWISACTAGAVRIRENGRQNSYLPWPAPGRCALQAHDRETTKGAGQAGKRQGCAHACYGRAVPPAPDSTVPHANSTQKGKHLAKRHFCAPDTGKTT